jgi:hypothetical protein
MIHRKKKKQKERGPAYDGPIPSVTFLGELTRDGLIEKRSLGPEAYPASRSEKP